MEALKPLLIRIFCGILTYGLGVLLASGAVISDEQKAWLTQNIGPAGELLAGLALILGGVVYGWWKHKQNAVAAGTGTGGKPGFVDPRLLAVLVAVVLVAATLSGCTAQATYRMDAATAVSQSLDQLQTALDESTNSTYARMVLERDNLWAAYQEDLAKAAAGPPASIPAELARLAAKYRAKEAVISASRFVVDTRASRATEHIRFMRETLADLYNLEEGNLAIQQKLERYRVLASEYARQKFGLTSPPEAPSEGALALPLTTPAAPATAPPPAK